MIEKLDVQTDQTTAAHRNDFLKSLTHRLDYIESSWATLLNSSGNRNHMTNFVGAVHFLAGGAGVHGFISMSQRAYKIIGHLQPCIRKNADLTQDRKHVIDHLVSSLFSLKEHYDEHGYSELDPVRQEELKATIENRSLGSNEIFMLEPSPGEPLALKLFLENAEQRVCSYTSLHKLQCAVENTPPRAVIVDLQQCNQDATASEFITGLQKREVPFPIIALSDSGDFQSRLQAARKGATQFFTKPVDGYRLVDTLYKATQVDSLPSRVLLVDDDPETAKYISIHLRKEGLDVYVLNDPSTLLEALAHFHPDLILTDLYMPDCNGLELATIVRQHEVYFDIPIVFLSSETDEDSRLAALQLGSDDFFTKSIDVDIVAKAIRSRLDRMASYAIVKKAMMWSPV